MFRILWSIFTVIIVVFIGLQLLNLYAPLPAADKSGSPLSKQLFDELNQQGLLTINKDSDWRISLPDRDTVLALQQQNAKQKQYDKIQKLIDNLYHQPYGERLQKQVALWNYTRRMAAIRDNRPQQDNKNQWKVNDEDNLVLDSFTTVPLYFGYITQGKLIKGFHDWKGASLVDRAILFSSDFELDSAQKITLQIVGKPDLSTLTIPHKVTAIFPKDAENTQSEAITYEVLLNLPKGKHHVQVPVYAIANPSREINGLAIAVVDKERYAKLEAVQEHCKAVPSEDSNANAELKIIWNNCSLANSPRHTANHVPFVITTRDNQPLTEAIDKEKPSAIGKPTNLTQKAGLTALIGQDKNDIYSLSGLMWNGNSKPNAELKLTLDSRLQQITQKYLEQGIKKHPPKQQQRRAAVVMLDPQTGQILAAANYPNPQLGVHLWDRKAISQLYPKNDPYQFNPWQGLTGDNAPGSTFKVVTAMAGLQAAEQNERVASLLKGASINDYKVKIGLDPNANQYKVPNAADAVKAISTGHTIAQSAGALFSKQCESNTQNRGIVGLQETTKQSVNTWFAHLGILMDANAYQNKQIPQLVKMANSLGFNQVYSLDTLGLQHYKAGAGRGDILNAYTGSMDLAQKASNLNDYLARLSQNSFGQGLTSTPLQIAKVAASVATGKNIQPQLFLSLGNQKAETPEQNDLDIPHLDWLRDGMKAVVQTGTAAGKFKGKLKCNVYGKTGTAEVGSKKHRRISPWFMGWYAPDEKPKLAFACMATHYPPNTKSFGGNVCAPIINNILTEWNKQGAAQ